MTIDPIGRDHDAPRVRHLRGVAFAVLTVVAALVGGCQEDLPPLPSALLVVDTDVSVPHAVDRLRIDVFGGDGTWLHSRDYPRPRAADWPASFGIVSNDESKPTTMLVRLRAYSGEALRDYVGERYAPRAVFSPTVPARTLAELCAAPVELPMNAEITLRRASTSVSIDPCGLQSQSGAVAVTIRIPTRDTYRFEVVRTGGQSVEGTLALRRNCSDPRSYVQCSQYVDEDDDFRPRLVTAVDPGTYTLVSGGALPVAADLTIRWGKAADWDATTPLPVGVPPPAAVSPLPRLRLSDGVDATPSTEPVPSATIDRLVAIEIAPQQSKTVRVKLAGACAGQMSKLAVDAGGRVDHVRSETCVDGATPLVTVLPTPAPASEQSALGTWAAEGCAADDSDERKVCVPGGTFKLGSREALRFEGALLAAEPSRIVGTSRFWMDRYEMTVQRYRYALANGLVATKAPLAPLVNEDDFDPDNTPYGLATFSEKPKGRERMPLNAIPWPVARAVCKHFGGDLPTEAQWEYAASAAGRSVPSRYPFGDTVPSCDVIAVGLFRPGCGPLRPVAVDDARNSADVNALGIVGMGGNVSELVRDAAALYDAPCWDASSALDSRCDDDFSPTRLVRGGNFMTVTNAYLDAPARVIAFWGQRSPYYGFRCVYTQREEASWPVP